MSQSGTCVFKNNIVCTLKGEFLWCKFGCIGECTISDEVGDHFKDRKMLAG